MLYCFDTFYKSIKVSVMKLAAVVVGTRSVAMLSPKHVAGVHVLFPAPVMTGAVPGTPDFIWRTAYNMHSTATETNKHYQKHG
jgi:hypothetical protein